MKITQPADHIEGGFSWEIEPKCQCGQLQIAIKDHFIFVSNFTEGGFNMFYMMPTCADGSFAKSDGVPIQHCPWCGDKIKGRKKYPTV